MTILLGIAFRQADLHGEAALLENKLGSNNNEIPSEQADSKGNPPLSDE